MFPNSGAVMVPVEFKGFKYLQPDAAHGGGWVPLDERLLYFGNSLTVLIRAAGTISDALVRSSAVTSFCENVTKRCWIPLVTF